MIVIVKHVYRTADEILRKSNKNHGSYYLTILPDVNEIIEEKYGDYLIPIDIRVNSLEERMKLLEKLKNEINKQINKLNEGTKAPTRVDDDIAEKQIIGFLKEYRKKGNTKINILKIASSLNLPITQVDDILDKLEEENLISDA